MMTDVTSSSHLVLVCSVSYDRTSILFFYKLAILHYQQIHRTTQALKANSVQKLIHCLSFINISYISFVCNTVLFSSDTNNKVTVEIDTKNASSLT